MRRSEAKPAGKLKVMVSSTVRGLETLLDQVYGILDGYGYEVWMSHKGTIPVHPREGLLRTSLRAVQDCDFFLGIITGFYNREVPRGEKSIAHQEFLHAVLCDKPRWFLVHHDVKVAHELLKSSASGETALASDSFSKRPTCWKIFAFSRCMNARSETATGLSLSSTTRTFCGSSRHSSQRRNG